VNIVLIDYSLINLRGHYDKKYNEIPKTDQEAISFLINVYSEEFRDRTPAQSVKDGIGEIYRELLGKGLPSYYWMLEAIHRTAKKRVEKRTFGYVVGTLRNWALYGFGNTLTDEEEELFDYFNEITGANITAESRKMITALLGRYGAIKLMRNLPDLRHIDVSVYLVEILARGMMDKYDEALPPPVSNEPSRKDVTPINSVPALSDGKRTKPKDNSKDKSKDKVKVNNPDRPKRKGGIPLSEKSKLMIMFVEDFVREKGTARPVEIAKYLMENGYDNVSQKNISSHMVTVLRNSEHISKVGKGIFEYK
jgi:hypothetical protein